MATTQYKDNAGNIYEFQQESGDAGGAEKRPVAGMPAAVRTQFANMTAALSALAGTVLDGVLKVTLQAGAAVIGKLAPNAGVNIGTVDVASGTFSVSGSLPTGPNHIGSVTVSTALPAGSNNIGDVDVLTLPVLPQLPATVGAKTSAASLSVVLASDHTARPVSLTTAVPAGTNNIGDVDIASMPPIPAGTNNIGDVDVLTLPPLPQLPAALGALAPEVSLSVTTSINQILEGVTMPVIVPQLPPERGPLLSEDSLSVVFATDQPPVAVALGSSTNNIGDVDVLTLPLLPQLPATVGAKASAASLSVVLASDQGTHPVSLSAALPAGNNNIGDVDVLTLPALPTGSNTIGKLAVNTGVNIGTVGLAAGTTNIGDVDVLTLPPLVAGTANIGDVDVLTLPALPQLPATVGAKTSAASLSVVLATDQGTHPVSLSAGTNNIGDVDVLTMPPVTIDQIAEGIVLPVSCAQLPPERGPLLAADSLSVTFATDQPAIPVTFSGGITLGPGTNNIGDVDVLTLPALQQLPATVGAKTSAASLSVVLATDQGTQNVALAAGTNNIGDVDVLTLPALPQLPATIGQKAKTASTSVVLASDQGTLPVSLAALPSLVAGTANIGDVDVLTLPALPQLPATVGAKTSAASLSVVLASDQALPAGTNNIGDVDVLTLPPLPAGTNNIGKVTIDAPTTATVTVVALTTVAVTFAASNPARVGLMVVNNDDTDTLYLKFGAGATATSWSVVLEPHVLWEMPPRYYAGIVTGVWGTAGFGDAHVTEIA